MSTDAASPCVDASIAGAGAHSGDAAVARPAEPERGAAFIAGLPVHLADSGVVLAGAGGIDPGGAEQLLSGGVDVALDKVRIGEIVPEIRVVLIEFDGLCQLVERLGGAPRFEKQGCVARPQQRVGGS